MLVVVASIMMTTATDQRACVEGCVGKRRWWWDHARTCGWLLVPLREGEGGEGY